MDDPSASDINTHMTAVVDDVSGLGVGIAHRLSGTSLGVRLTGNGDPEMLVYCPSKTGAVRAVGQAGATGYIGIPHKLQCVAGNGGAGTAAGYGG